MFDAFTKVVAQADARGEFINAGLPGVNYIGGRVASRSLLPV
jgi:hypothetical protein